MINPLSPSGLFQVRITSSTAFKAKTRPKGQRTEQWFDAVAKEVCPGFR